jgi:hypothetical protein
MVLILSDPDGTTVHITSSILLFKIRYLDPQAAQYESICLLFH